jgi:integrase
VSDKRKVADAAAAKIQAEVAAGTFKGPQHGGTKASIGTFGELAREWYAAHEPGIRPATRVFYRQIVKALRAAFGEKVERTAPGVDVFSGRSKEIASITFRDCERLISEKRAESDSPCRANRYLTVLRSIFKAAVEWELLDRNPTEKIRKQREPLREYDVTPEDLTKILVEAEAWLRPVILMGFYTGARRADLLGVRLKKAERPGLTWADVDLDRKVVTFRGTKEKRTRHVPICDELLTVLKAMPSRFQGGPVFIDEAGVTVTPDRALRAFQRAAVAAKVPHADRLRFHDLRHAFGTSLAELNVSLREIQALLGHAQIGTTERYLHAREARLRDAVARLSGTVVAQSGSGAAAGKASKDA